MNREAVAKEILAVVKMIAGETSSIDGVSNIKAKKLINSLMGKYTTGTFRDDYWAPIHAIFKELDNAGISYVVEKTEYKKNKDGEPESKRWSLEFPFTNDKGKPVTLYGVIVASGAGSIAHPLEIYDVVAYVG